MFVSHSGDKGEPRKPLVGRCGTVKVRIVVYKIEFMISFLA